MAQEILIPTPQSCNEFNIQRKPSQPRDNPKFLDGEQYSQNRWFRQFQRQRPVETNINEITLDFKPNTPYEISREGTDIIRARFSPPSGGGDEPIVRVKIVPNFDHENGLEISHNHKWDSATDMFSSLMNKAVGMIADINNFAVRMQQIQDPDTVATSIRHDIAEQYVSTDKQRIVIPFSLFTKKDFVRDILTPLMVLTSLSYPKRKSDEDLNQTQDRLDTITQSSAGEQFSRITESIGGAAQSAGELANNLIPGYRVFTIENPPLVDVYHSGKLFKYVNCYISNITYNFLGPWINADGVGDPNALEAFKEVYQGFSNWKKTVPTKAECTIELATTEPHFSDDYVSILKEARKDANSAGGRRGSRGSSDGLVSVLSNRGI